MTWSEGAGILKNTQSAMGWCVTQSDMTLTTIHDDYFPITAHTKVFIPIVLQRQRKAQHLTKISYQGNK